MAVDNPFAHASPLPFELPPFDQIRDSDYLPAFEAGMRAQLKEVEAIAHNSEPATFENTIVALERSGRLLDRVDTVFSNLSSCNTDDEMQKVDTEMAPKLAAHQDAIFLNAALWARIDALYGKRDEPRPRSGVAAAPDALPHPVRARRRAALRRRPEAAAGDQRADLDAHDALPAERAQGHRRRRGGGRQAVGSRRA